MKYICTGKIIGPEKKALVNFGTSVILKSDVTIFPVGNDQWLGIIFPSLRTIPI